MDLNELRSLYLHRQSCREFADKKLPEDLLTEICRTALLAPSATNAQPWRLIALTGEKKEEVLPALQRLGMNAFASRAAALVVVAEGKNGGFMKVGALLKENEFVLHDLGLLTAHLVLAAEAAGVGSCILGWRDEARLRALLGLGDKTRVPVVVALGYPAEGYPVREKKRKPTEETFSLLTHRSDKA